MRTSAGIAAVLVSYNTRDLLVECVRQLRRSPLVKRVIVIDNASADGSADAVRRSDPNAIVIDHGINTGFARAVNRGLQEVNDLDVLLINPDCVLEPDALERMSHWLDDHPRTGVVAPATYHPLRRTGVLSAGEQPDLRRIALHYSGLSRILHRQRWGRGWNLLAGKHDDIPRMVGWASGSCLLVRSNLMRELGGLTERWFMYAEDMELCARARASKYEVVHLPSAHATHIIGASTPTGSVSTRWVSTLVDYYRTAWTPGRIRLTAYQAVLVAGLGSRAGINLLRLITARSSTLRRAYLTEAHRNIVWARAAWSPEREHLDLAPSRVSSKSTEE